MAVSEKGGQPVFAFCPDFAYIQSAPRSYSKLMAFEAARILHHLGSEVRIYDPSGLPVKDDVQHHHPKVQELRQLSDWSEAQFWCSPEQHGNITAVMKNQSELDLPA
jgi:NAD(P)H-dependent FMN reductase